MEIDDKDIMKTLLFTLITLITCFLACSKNDVTGPLNTAPSIEDQLFEITENANIGTIIGTILATDLDEDTLSFEILEGNLENVFTLNSSTGELSLSQSLNIEVTESYVLLVQVTDDIASAQANIWLRGRICDARPHGRCPRSTARGHGGQEG
ncbi:MAG: cadherin repeat domain-containing protein [Actinobacteria bacterium]|nr:cadherin repeat domain-containing protein [Actinomycetota bacterium]